MTAVRLRGIYSTALTRLLLDAGHEVVQASDPIRERFDADLSAAPAAVSVADTDDRQGVGLSGAPDAVAELRDLLADALGRDALAWSTPAPRGAVFDGVVTDSLGSGAVVALADDPAPPTAGAPLPGVPAEGFLPFDAVDGYVEEGDRLRVQVDDPAAPWDDDRPLLDTGIEVPGELVSLVRGRDDATAAVRGERGTELVRTTDLLPAEAPDGWGVRWERAAADAEMSALGDALSRAAERAAAFDEGLSAADPDADDPRQVVAPQATVWVWFGRESRFALDERRRDVTTTMPGHHRTKAADRAASDAVDFVEAVGAPDGEFPFGAVADQFGPREDDRLALGHGKPDGRLITLGRGEVTDRGDDGSLTLRREMRSSGTYDAIGTDREPGDVAITKLVEGRWWYPTMYRGADGERKGTYVNICTPVELFPDAARYVDLHVDVVKRPDGEVERVDADELDAAVEAGYVSEELAEKARSVAGAVENAL
ncbi:RNA-binding protein AU-1 [Natronoarchaeum philippinense]|uniref:Probable ribonuclease FAU-1 n=1 Tax=Natronoarchaeum philippinense TaxID=558529 RepID=A0A285P6S5_NATPI|nr:DUF402 domain-containing protein [Natronoarchaeum philippinense]SNZ17459.1 RNA-binding protein AU-1 [Natronoarchaeum philippinense]